jgi:hypothetical protein
VLARLVLFTKGKVIDRRLIKSGHDGIPESGTEITDLGPSIDVLVLARGARPYLAMKAVPYISAPRAGRRTLRSVRLGYLPE